MNEKLDFFDLPTVGLSSGFVVGGRVLLAGLASDLVFCDGDREAEASALAVVGSRGGLFCRS